jgi:RimJ/RimL family protein N-acetyltransferase
VAEELLKALLLDIPEALETERLALRASRAGQGAALNEAMAESLQQLRPWMPWARQMQTVEQSESFARESQAKWLARETLDFSWYRKADGLLVGRGGLHTIDWTIPKFEIGYWIRTSCARNGYATESTRALAAFARDRLGARRLEITSDARNAGSRRVAEKCGFTLEGILRQSRRANDGTLADSCMYAAVF